ncbi:transcription regulator protein BACH1-like [Gouania willdenowi]|uniref:transcription regulator protein BACH1-like n=1 Tax=Gouania willdenowi TaxID=441366 RepID=UPI001055E657|nr:transcription regulator protein BACH1-like [Gouania willdenowi]
MTLQAPRVSVFTFQSAVHSTHVLQCLNEQRQQDVLCDVTVVVEDQCFRAHRSVLASCSEYFHSRVSMVTQQNPIVTLPDEVTVEGFEPLLQFAYTSKLLFTKENIQAVHNCAEFLGFHNLESACFDFLTPKFSEGKKKPTSQESVPRACCQNQVPAPNFGSSAKKNRSKAPMTTTTHSSGPSASDEQTHFHSQFPLSTKAEVGSGEEEVFCLENCGPQMAPLSLDLTANRVCPMLSSLQTDSLKSDPASQFSERDILEMEDVCNQAQLSLAECDLSCDVNPAEILQSEDKDVKQAVETLGAENDCSSCPIGTSGIETEDGVGKRSRVEREVAEHLAKGFWSDLCPAQAAPLPLEQLDQSSLEKASDFHWLKQLDLTSSTGDCPFLRNLETAEDSATQTESLSQPVKSPYISSSLNSGDDSELDTDPDTEANIRRAAEIQLPFAVEQILTLSRSSFQQLLRKHSLTQDQQEFVHDVRRRSKNRVAAQRCRKRKLEGIHQLQHEIKKLMTEKQRLVQEQTELEQNLEEIKEGLHGLCKSVGIKSSSDGVEHLQLLSKLSSTDSDAYALSPVRVKEESEITIEMVDCSSGYDPSGFTEGSDLSGSRDAIGSSSGDAGSPVPASLLSACMNMSSL